MLNLPRFKAAAVQAAAAFLDPVATVDKAASLIREAAANGAALVAFPEVFVAGYPYWSWIVDPVAGSAWFEKLVRASIMVPGPEVDQLCTVAREAGVHVVIGVNERSPVSLGTLYNTMLFIGPDGEILGKHRKLVPTWAEKLTWALGQGELVHVARHIALPVAPPDYDMAEAIRVRAAAHCFEGKLFTIVSCSTVSEEIIAAMETLVPDARARLERKNSAFSGILGPDGRTVGAPLIDEEGIVYAEIDLSRCIQPKQMHDSIGHYTRFDIFDLRVNAMPQQPVRIAAETKAEPLPALADAPSS